MKTQKLSTKMNSNNNNNKKKSERQGLTNFKKKNEGKYNIISNTNTISYEH